jgi:hypothetical protein
MRRSKDEEEYLKARMRRSTLKARMRRSKDEEEYLKARMRRSVPMKRSNLRPG